MMENGGKVEDRGKMEAKGMMETEGMTGGPGRMAEDSSLAGPQDADLPPR
jgi:hypothetical protein